MNKFQKLFFAALILGAVIASAGNGLKDTGVKHIDTGNVRIDAQIEQASK